MSNATFSRKPLVAAVLTTLAVFSAGAMAGNEDQPVNKDVTLTVGTGDNTVSGTVQNEQTWDEAWAQKFNENFKNAEGKVTISTGNGSDKITISKGTDDKTSGKLTNKLSSLTLNVGLDVAEGGTFVNNGTLEANKAITVTGSLVNTGTLKINNNLTINGLDKTTDLEAAPASVVMGDITLTNATLTNNDKGYKLKTEADKKEGEDDKTRVRVTYGKITLNKAQAFEQGEDGKIDDGDYHKGTVTLSGYKADWKVENATSKTGTEGDAETEQNGSWDVTKFGSVTVYNNAQLTISSNKVNASTTMAIRLPCRSGASRSIRRSSR